MSSNPPSGDPHNPWGAPQQDAPPNPWGAPQQDGPAPQPQYPGAPTHPGYSEPHGSSPYSGGDQGMAPYQGGQQGMSQYGAPSVGAPGYAPLPQQGVATADTGLVNISGLGTVKVATLGQRALARIIDQVMYGVMTAILFMVAGGIASTDDGSGAGMGAAMLVFFIGMVFIMLYEFLMIAFLGRTVGKMLMGIKVVDMRNGQNPGMGASFMRILIPWIGYWLCGLVILVYLSPLFDSSGKLQGWHDRAANDLVIGTR